MSRLQSSSSYKNEKQLSNVFNSVLGKMSMFIRLPLNQCLVGPEKNIILIKFLISDEILITCRELYIEVVGHVYLIKVSNFPENEIITVKDHVQNDTCS